MNRKIFQVMIIAAIALSFGTMETRFLSIANAQDVGTSVNRVTQEVLLESGEYFTAKRLSFSEGEDLDEYMINGPPTPPAGYEIERTTVALPKADEASGINTLTVPAFNWVFGCSSVSGAMIAGYYDRNGYVNMYVGPANGGVMPLNNSSWPTWSDGYKTYPNLPLAGSHKGVDGRTTRGSIDDYWVKYESSSSDPYISGSWTQHTWSDAIGDYMKTSQSAYDNTDGSTTFYNWTSSPGPLTCSDMVTQTIQTKDGTYGRKLFYEARGYTVTECYNQRTDNQVAGGFSFGQFKTEIDAGRPVMLNLKGHTVVGVGYDDTANTVYIHDTWDYSNHTMTWGQPYSGMELLSVSIVNLQANLPKTLTALTIKGPTRVKPSSSATYTATATWSNGSTSTVTPSWSENSLYASINTSGVLSTTAVSSDQWITITASYTNGGITKSDTHTVIITARLFPWHLFLSAINTKTLPEPIWGVDNDVCCPGGAYDFALTTGGMTKHSTNASCSSSSTWQGWTTSTEGQKSFSWNLSGGGCSTYLGNFKWTLKKGMKYLFESRWNGSTVEIWVVQDFNGAMQKGDSPIDQLPIAKQLIGVIHSGGIDNKEVCNFNLQSSDD